MIQMHCFHAFSSWLPGRRRRAMWALAPALLVGPLACTPPARPGDAAIYAMVLVRVRSELDLPAVSVHPLLARTENREAEHVGELTHFNTFDTATVAASVRMLPGALYRLCAPLPGGSCPLVTEGASVVLSETIDMGSNGVGIQVLVTDGRRGQDVQRLYLARVKAGVWKWSVVELQRRR